MLVPVQQNNTPGAWETLQESAKPQGNNSAFERDVGPNACRAISKGSTSVIHVAQHTAPIDHETCHSPMLRRSLRSCLKL